MWIRPVRILDLIGPALLVSLAVGCDTAPPGGGLTNGPEPDYAPEKPAERTDLPPPVVDDSGIAPGTVSSNPEGGTGTEAGLGGRNGGEGGLTPAEPSKSTQGDVPATPPALEGPAGFDAAGPTVPRDNIKAGTPKTPQ